MISRNDQEGGQRLGRLGYTGAVCVFLSSRGALAVVGEAHTTVLVGAPGQGDEVQAMKAGLLELADVLVVNQADRDGAPALVNAWRWAVEDGGSHRSRESGWRPPIIETVATTGQGVPELAAALDQHRTWLADSGGWERRAECIAGERVLRSLAHHLLVAVRRRATGSDIWDQLIADVAARRLDPATAAARLAATAFDTEQSTDTTG